MQRKIVISLGAMCAFLAFAGQSVAAPVPGQTRAPSGAEQMLIERVHGCHRDVLAGAAGWHYHRGPHCRRYSVSPPRRHYRGPRCYIDCKYVGPIKVCKKRCY